MARASLRAATAEPALQRPFWSQVLRALREARGVTRDGWAAALGYGRTTVQRWETGESVPDSAAEAAIVALCHERGLFHLVDRSSLAGFTSTPESLAALLAAARLGDHAPRPPSESGRREEPRRTNLPLPLTSFVGREHELAAVPDLLMRARLLTLAGIGGVGKTRLALEIGHALVDRHPDGVWLADLAPLTEPALVPQAVAMAVDVRERPGVPIVDLLVDALTDKRLLLVLDNCEHLVAACAELVERLLRACGGVQILATSRDVLGVGGETVVRVPALTVPSAPRSLPLVRLAHFEAVRLFVERVRARQPYFALSDATVPAVVDICRRLDGIPLALELAAARTPALSVEQLAARLDGSFRLLASGSRSAPSRQKTLTATLDWSYDLLSERERVLLSRLATFAGGFSLTAAETVGAGDGIEAGDVLDLLAQLIDRSLVNVEPEAEVRYRLLDIVRQFALAKPAPDELARARNRHAGWYVTLAEMAEPKLVGPEQGMWLARLEQEHDNLRAALAWSSEREDVMSLLRLAGALWRFWEVRGHFAEGRRWLEMALARSDDAPATARAKVLTGAGLLARLQDDYPRSLRAFEEALTLFRAADDQQGTATTLIHLGLVDQHLGNVEEAVRCYEQGLALFRMLGDLRRSAIALANLGGLAQQQGDFDQAALRQEEALTVFREIGDQGGIALALGGLGSIEAERGNHARAAELLEDALALFQSLGDQRRIAVALVNLGDVDRARAARALARSRYIEALQLNRDLGQKEGIAYCLEGLAGIALDEGDFVLAAQLFGAVTALRGSIGVQRPPSERMKYDAEVVRARAGLTEDAFDAAWERGRIQPLNDLIDCTVRQH